ncbi:hypothetical protein XENOCAPTIV_025884 [Xenoophorus captivus]|uniref:Uncharacterized protein n=1 Tax=Xenoophorus captivus TaxID=1517983 RepID=A0ABV0RB97_9TELE
MAQVPSHILHPVCLCRKPRSSLCKRASRIIFSVGCIPVSRLLRLPVNEPGSPSTVLPPKIIHLVPPLPQVQVRQDYLHLDTLREFPSIFLLFPPGGSPNHPLYAKYIKINNPEYSLPLTIDPFSIQ